jgi:hypothetical protein
MKNKKLHIKITYMQQPLESDSESDCETTEDVMRDLKSQMEQIEALSKSLDTHIVDLYRRTKADTVDWMHEPLKPRSHIGVWCAKKQLSARPTIREFIDACFSSASSMDLNSRTLTFCKEDAVALWNGQRRLTVFDIIERIPTIFE